MSSSLPEGTPSEAQSPPARRWRLGIGAKVALGFGAVLAFHMAVAIVGHVGLSRALSDLDRIDAVRRSTGRMVEIDRLVQELQENVMLYAFTGHESAGDRVVQLQGELRVHLDAAPADDMDAGELAEMQAILDRYGEHFRLAKEDRGRRKHLVDKVLVEGVAQASSALGDLQQSWESDEALTRELTAARQDLIEAQKGTFEYVQNLDYPAMREAITSAERCQERLESALGTAPDREGVEAAIKRIAAYGDALGRVVQHTRGYLHLVNVVIAGETAAFLRFSEQVRARHERDLEAVHAQIGESQGQFGQWNVYVSLATIVAALAAGAMITRSVVTPMREIASTLEHLGSGEQDVEIPCRTRGDEVGDMARAAEVFRGRNAEIATLLDDTKRSNRDLEQFANVASHDLQEPLRMVASYLQLIEKRYADKLDEDGLEFIGYATGGAARMKSLINDLLAYSRVGRSQGEPGDVDVLHVIDAVRRDLESSIAESEALVCHDGSGVTVWADRSQIQQVVHNLVGNAIKFRGDSRPEVVVGWEESHGGWRIWVRDNGIGIDPAHAERIFTVFQRLHSREEYPGTGIGLSICRRVVEGWGGRIWVESEPGGGSRFVFTIPRPRPTALQAEAVHRMAS